MLSPHTFIVRALMCRNSVFMITQKHFIVYCRCRGALKLLRFLQNLIMFLLSLLGLIGPADMCRNPLFLTIQKHSIAYSRCREAVMLIGFLLSLLEYDRTCKNVQKSTLLDDTETLNSLRQV
jgi:hypothetical protein